ncbi:hypothetical protein A0J61_05907 [Choanephora cucurbitarum]|uniref:Uncharacterized protein n=1 Tax=Choanephora cucurbitarum TaxID=101091 RepID=A0A1C7NAA7_9FUNG|nr:hypothetical protein A0J61_05907 [Choanephora cucurbitarum]
MADTGFNCHYDCSVIEGESYTNRRRSSCCSHCNTNPSTLNVLEYRTLQLTPPLGNVYFEQDEDQPFTGIYLLNLFLTPDIHRYLAEAPVSDDIYTLPLHLQRLLCEARLEMVISPNEREDNKAMQRLEKLKAYVNGIAHHDAEAIITTLNRLVHDEDELSNIIGD